MTRVPLPVGHTHSWRECRPAVVSLSGQDPSDAAVAVEMVWATVSDSERQAFHRACCFNSTAAGDMVVMGRIIEAITARLMEVEQ